jgi:hypothetical protein
MELSGPDRLNVTSSLTLTVKGLTKLESKTLPAGVGGSKLVGCQAIALSTLLERVRPNLGNGVSGIFTASDGVVTDPISFDELVKGFIVHSDAQGGALSQGLGGLVRLVFPDGVAVQAAVCGTPKAVNLKGVIKLELKSTFEVEQLAVAKQLAASAPSIILYLEEHHGPKLLAIAYHLGCHLEPREQPVEKVRIMGLDARGLMLRVVRPGGTKGLGGTEGELLAPFPRPLVDGADIVPLTFEMHARACAALGWRFRMRHHDYISPLFDLLASPRVAQALAAVAAVTAAFLVLRRARYSS